ncbi:hypothetical protein EVU92_05925 [Pseudoalteromonas sp. MEBiC 03485]|nr:hypothetical protein EVU92_05925 [Pseudoalteromonas sp. MEBiC 03485]
MQEWHSLLKSNNAESKPQRIALWVGLKAIYSALLNLTREQPFFAFNALPKSLLIPTETVSRGSLSILIQPSSASSIF